MTEKIELQIFRATGRKKKLLKIITVPYKGDSGVAIENMLYKAWLSFVSIRAYEASKHD
jgi:hypothetical protein